MTEYCKKYQKVLYNILQYSVTEYSKRYWKVLSNIVRYCGMRRRGAGQTPSSVTIVGEVADIKSYQPLTSYPPTPHILLFPN